MQVKVTEHFYRKRSYTHRYDHLLMHTWELVSVPNVYRPFYVIQCQDLVEEVDREDFVIHLAEGVYVS